MPFFDGPGGRVYYREWTAANPTAGVVFLHGFGEHTGHYHRFAGALNHRGISVWGLDQIGHGLTEGERGVVPSIGDLSEIARLLTGMAECAAPGLPLALVGHSMGGVTAAQVACRDPGRYVGLVLTGTPLPEPIAAPAAEHSGPGDVEVTKDPFYLDLLENDPLAFPNHDVLLPAALAVMGAVGEEIEQRLPTVQMPILLVNGERDAFAPPAHAEGWAERLSRARALRYEGAYHDILNDTVHAEVAADIADFVEKALSLPPADPDRHPLARWQSED